MPCQMYAARFSLPGYGPKRLRFMVWFSAIRQLERPLLRRMARFELVRLIGAKRAIGARLDCLRETETEACE